MPLSVDKGADGGVMITASHNPPRYNGIKLKAAFGGRPARQRAKEVERRILAAGDTLPRRIEFSAAQG
jgi:phosphomannomutase